MDDKALDLQLARTIQAALIEKANQIALGATREEAEANFEKTVRATWPFTREWHYLCERCGDTGWREFRCKKGQRCDSWSLFKPSAYMRDTRIKRRWCADEANNYEHDAIEFCVCPKGESLKRAYERSDQGTKSEDFSQAGKTQKPAQPFRR